jgi:hypothetical protein
MKVQILQKGNKCTIQLKNFSAEVSEYESNPSNETVPPKKKHKSQYILVQIRKKRQSSTEKRYPAVVKEIPKENH